MCSCSRLFRIFAMALIIVSCGSEDEKTIITAPEGLFINEIASAGEDWIELFNGFSEAKNLSGYIIYDDGPTRYTLPSGTIIPSNGFLVILCNDVGLGLQANFKLSSAGESVFLENTSGGLVDFLEAPKLDNGQSYGRYPDGTSNLSISGSQTKGSSNTNSNTPAITLLTRVPQVPSLNQAVVIQAELANTSQLQSIRLFYRFNSGSFTSVAMEPEGSFYNATIPAQNVTGKMEYYVEVKNTSGVSSFKPFDAPEDSYNYLLNTDALPTLYINEFMASNTACCPDNAGGTPEFDDWIEIYNGGTTPINLAGMYLSDDRNDPFKAKIPGNNASATTIQPGGFMIFWADEQSNQGTRHMNFKLSATGEDVALFYIDGRKIDERQFGAQAENKSSGRTTNGGATWTVFNTPTPSNSNN